MIYILNNKNLILNKFASYNISFILQIWNIFNKSILYSFIFYVYTSHIKLETIMYKQMTRKTTAKQSNVRQKSTKLPLDSFSLGLLQLDMRLTIKCG